MRSRCVSQACRGSRRAADRWYEAAREDISQQDIEDLLHTAQGSVCEEPVEPTQSPTADSQAPESFSVVGGAEEALPSDLESSSDSSSSSSSDSTDSEGIDDALEDCQESLPQVPEDADDLCSTYQHVRTNTLHLLPKGQVCVRPSDEQLRSQTFLQPDHG